MLERLYSIAESIIAAYATIMNYLTSTMVGDYSLLEVMVGFGITYFVGLTLAKWIVEFIP